MAKDQFYDALAPFVSLTLAVPKTLLTGAALVERALIGMAELAGVAERKGPTFGRVTAAIKTDKALGSVARAFRYKRRVTPGWTTDSGIEDIENHLVIAIAVDNRLALHFSDARLRGPVRFNLKAEHNKDAPLAWLDAVSRGMMSAAFLESGQARTLWLSGTHRRTTLKADTKILSGLDLEYALDPFEDQSFYWSAARSNNTDLNSVIGVSPASSRIWITKVASFSDFVTTSVAVLGRLAAVKKPADATFRYLASPLLTVAGGAVHSAFDASIMPPDLSADLDGDEQEIAALASLIYETNLHIIKSDKRSPSFTLNVVRSGGHLLGELAVVVSIAQDGRVTFTLDRAAPTALDPKAFAAVAEQIKKGGYLNVRYDTGHSISSGRVFTLRNRRVGFGAYDPRDFDGFDVEKEKPSNLTMIGREDSLFCWVQQNFDGWLACDDGSMEKADFVHIDDGGARPILSLIHVKGAHSKAVARGVSVSAYEVVTAQAVKNLLWLDRDDLAKGVEISARAANHFWHNRRPSTKEAFLARLAAMPANHDTRVIVLQPHLTSAVLARTQRGKANAETLRMDQLSALLASAQRTCGAIGATFSVICSA